jgi:hypothetical protein
VAVQLDKDPSLFLLSRSFFPGGPCTRLTGKRRGNIDKHVCGEYYGSALEYHICFRNPHLHEFFMGVSFRLNMSAHIHILMLFPFNNTMPVIIPSTSNSHMSTIYMDYDNKLLI